MDNEWKFPPCFKTLADYELWLANPYQENLGAQHCTDCLPSFKMRMAKAGRCSHPETTFRFAHEVGFDPADEGVHIYGVWTPLPMPKVIRKVRKIVERKYSPNSPRAKRLAMGINPKPVGIVEREQNEREYWAAKEREMRERMSRGR